VSEREKINQQSSSAHQYRPSSFTILIRFAQPISERERKLHYSHVWLALFKKWSKNKSLSEPVINIPRFLNPSKAYLKGNEEQERDLANWLTKNNLLFWRFNLNPDRQPNCSKTDNIGGKEAMYVGDVQWPSHSVWCL